MTNRFITHPTARKLLARELLMTREHMNYCIRHGYNSQVEGYREQMHGARMLAQSLGYYLEDPDSIGYPILKRSN